MHIPWPIKRDIFVMVNAYKYSRSFQLMSTQTANILPPEPNDTDSQPGSSDAAPGLRRSFRVTPRGQRGGGRAPKGRYWIATTSAASGECDPVCPNPEWIQFRSGQLERGTVGGQQGFLHWQWILYSKKQLSRSYLKGFYPSTHWELCRSDKAEQYVTKEETRVCREDLTPDETALLESQPCFQSGIVFRYRHGCIER